MTGEQRRQPPLKIYRDKIFRWQYFQGLRRKERHLNRAKERERDRERQRAKESERARERKREIERERERERKREREKERKRERERERGRQRERYRDGERRQRKRAYKYIGCLYFVRKWNLTQARGNTKYQIISEDLNVKLCSL